MEQYCITFLVQYPSGVVTMPEYRFFRDSRESALLEFEVFMAKMTRLDANIASNFKLFSVLETKMLIKSTSQNPIESVESFFGLGKNTDGV